MLLALCKSIRRFFSITRFRIRLLKMDRLLYCKRHLGNLGDKQQQFGIIPKLSLSSKVCFDQLFETAHD